MASEGTASVIIGARDEDGEYEVHHSSTGTIQVELTKSTTMVFYSAGELLNLSNALKAAADEVDKRQANLADVHNPPLSDEAKKAITKGYSY